MEKDECESYKHRAACDVLCDWLRSIAATNEYCELPPIYWRRNRGPPHYGVWKEYPFGRHNDPNIVWDEASWHDDSHADSGTTVRQHTMK